MLPSLPRELLDVFERSVTTEYVTIDDRGQPIAWPVTPYLHAEHGCIDVTTGIGYPKKADDAARNPRVALLFSDPTGSGIDEPPMVLVQGSARVDEHDLAANRERYREESAAKLPATKDMAPPKALARLFSWYYDRIYVHVLPERVYRWHGGDPGTEPELFDARLEEVRSAHNAEPEGGHAAPAGGDGEWDARLEELGASYPTAVLAFVGPDGFPFAVRAPVRADRDAGVVRIEADPVGAPIEPGLACLTAHAHAPDFSWQRNFQVRGDLTEDGHGGWVLRPRRLVGGFELPPGSFVQRYRLNARKVARFRKIAKARSAARAARD
jgi:hypothetical protein